MQGNPKKIDVVIVNDEAEAPSILNPMSGHIFITNAIGKRVMELANGERNLETIVTEVSKKFKGASLDVIKRDVTVFLETCTSKQLVHWV